MTTHRSYNEPLTKEDLYALVEYVERASQGEPIDTLTFPVTAMERTRWAIALDNFRQV